MKIRNEAQRYWPTGQRFPAASRRESFGALALQVNGAHEGEKLEVIFPPGDEKAVAAAMGQIVLPRNSTKQ